MAAEEQTGWRDEQISIRHRAWGADCPAADLDFVLVEYYFAKPVAIIEYKNTRNPPDLTHPTIKAMSDLATRAGLPFFVARYWPKTWAFVVVPVNDYARSYFTDPLPMTEREYVQFLYKLRRLSLAESLAGKLADEMPPEA